MGQTPSLFSCLCEIPTFSGYANSLHPLQFPEFFTPRGSYPARNDFAIDARQSFPSPQRGKVRMCRNPGVLTYDWDDQKRGQVNRAIFHRIFHRRTQKQPNFS